ncbi:MAG: outer membrane beta-barrel protein [Polaribacter sp.]|nr:outer membrane beta-barrel protein [Polaribacter sp.]MDG1811946.1 outer membrane beta-barrel protein [Polaribacter sp.]MDG1992998.1 outer membrane beta-barrel protein [Polaribacter sp.]
MKKALLIICLIFGIHLTTHAQVDFGIKGGLNYNSSTFSDVKEDVLSGAESKTGYHAGVWLRFKIPVVGFYIRPELVYTNLENKVDYSFKVLGNTFTKATTYSFQKIDIPVLLGKKLFGVGNVYIGPSFQYILSSKFGLSDFKEINSDGFTLGLQFGGGIELGKIGLDVRWERAFSGVETSFIENTETIEFDTRVNQIMVGLSYKF